VHQTILPGAHTPLTGVSTPHLYCGTSMVLPWLLPSSLLGGPLPLLVSGSDFLALMLWDIWTLTIFILFYFIFLILLFFSFIFFWKMMKQARDKEVKWQVTWCDVISLEPDRKVWKMISGHLEYIWWPWVRSEVSMRLKHGHKDRIIY